MITEDKLNEAIAEMTGQRHPDANTCLKLASYYTIRNELFPKNAPQIDRGYSAAPPPGDYTIDYDSGTEFSQAINGRDITEVLKVLDELMTGLYVVNPPFYRRIMRDLTE